MRADWVPKERLRAILWALTPENRIACEVSYATGLRINDVLNLRPEQVRKQRFTIREEKTGKTRRVRLPKHLVDECLNIAGQHYVFEHRTNGRKHRTRQAVFKDLKKAAAAFGVKENVSPHTARKVFAVEEYEKTGDLKRVQKLLNHSDEAVTLIYALANQIGKKRKKKR